MNATPGTKSRPLAAIVVVALLVLLAVTMFNLQATKQQLERMTMKMDKGTTGDTTESKEEARKVVAQLRKVYALPDGIEPTVAAIVDVETLRKKNAFYNTAKNGDYLVVTTERAILFDAKEGKVLDVIPVQLQPVVPSTQSSAKSVPAAAKKAPVATPPAANPAPATDTAPAANPQ